MDIPAGEGIKQVGDGEYLLMKEELMQDCTPMTFGFASEPVTHKRFPAIILKEILLNRKQYENGDADSKWAIAHSHGMLDMIFLDLLFNKSNKIRVCFNNTMFCEMLMDWFKLLIETKGELVLSDMSIVGEINGIKVTNVPLDIPSFIVQVVRLRID